MPEPQSFKPLFLRGGTVVNHDASSKADVLIQDGIIRAVGTDLSVPDDARIIDVTDQLLLPGGVDLDCHLSVPNLNDPVADTFASASRVSLLGGTTTLINTVIAHPGESLITVFEGFLSSAKENFACDYGVCIDVPNFNSEIEEELATLVNNKGVTMFGVRLGSQYKTSCDIGEYYMSEEEFYFFMRRCRQLGALPVLQACVSQPLTYKLTRDLMLEQPDIGPEIHTYVHPERAEANTILRACLFSSYAGFHCPLLVSRVQSDAALECLTKQRRLCRGLLFGQTSVSAIGIPLTVLDSRNQSTTMETFTFSKDWATAASYLNIPPIRPCATLSQKLLSHLTSGDLISVGSGHRAIATSVRAALGLRDSSLIPHGVAAVGCRLIILWHFGVENACILDPCAFVKVVSSDPARLANLYPRKGRIAVGSDADVLVWSTAPHYVDFKKFFPEDVPNNFSEIKCRSSPQMVILRGQVVVENYELSCMSDGVFLSSQPFAHYVYDRVSTTEQNVNVELRPIAREPYSGNVATKDPVADLDDSYKESHYFRKEYYDNVPKVALPPGQRKIHTSVKTAQPPGGSSNAFWLNE